MTTDDDDGESRYEFLWHEQDSETVWQALMDARLVASADNTRALLEQIKNVVSRSAEEEAELSRRIAAGRRAADALSDSTDADRHELDRISRDGDRAKQALVEANLELVTVIAKRYTGRGTVFLDLIDIAKAGLSQAADRFDASRGYRFSVYATWWIRQAIVRRTLR